MLADDRLMMLSDFGCRYQFEFKNKGEEDVFN